MVRSGEGASDDLSLEIVRRIRDGDREAWDKLYRRYHDALLLAIRCRLGARLRARIESEDILQSVVREAMGDLERFEPQGPGSLGHYLHVCVLNKIRAKAQYFQAAKRAGDVPLSDTVMQSAAAPGTGEGPAYHDAERYGRLEKGLAVLPENLREALLLRTVEGLSNQEAARILGKSEEATSKLYNRALARLATTLGPPAP
jgi:RNA polymerase sigma factor (sigma-70 family)